MKQKRIEELIAGPQFQMTYQEKQLHLLPKLLERAESCSSGNKLIGKHDEQLGFKKKPIKSYTELPYLPVSMFKTVDLATVPQKQVVRTLLSSATTSGIPSRIPLDKTTSRRQAQGLAAILKDTLGTRRRPFLVLDCAEINHPGGQLSARGAAVRGIMPFASETCYALLQEQNELVPDIDAMALFFSEHAEDEVLLFGFTFMVWTDVVLKLRQLGVQFNHPRMTLLHSGGWKKLIEQQVDKNVFNTGVADVFGCAPAQVRDFYGMIEQVGVVFVDCEAGNKHSPAFAEVAIRNFDSLKQVEPGEKGLIQVMSLLPNSYPGHALITEDVGELMGYDDCPCGRKGLYFRFRSRVNQVEVRGCGDTLAVSRKQELSSSIAAQPAISTQLPVMQLAGQNCFSEKRKIGVADDLRKQLMENSFLTDLPVAAIIALLDDAAQRMISDEYRNIEGLSFLSAWMRRNNLEQVLEANFGGKRAALDTSIAGAKNALRASPRGLVGHWVAGNVPTLAMFSWVLATLGKNSNILRTSEAGIEPVRLLFKAVAKARINWQGQTLSGEHLLSQTCVVYFPSEDMTLNTAMSMACDARVIWGGSSAVAAIRSLPCMEHCEDLVFGPKFSMVVIDRGKLTDPLKRRDLTRKLAHDVAVFEQAACSSPQVVFLEGTINEHADWIEDLHSAMADLQQKSPRKNVSESAAANIIRLRSSYGLSPQCRVLASSGTEHSILAADGVDTDDAVQARTLFVRGLERLEDCLPLLSPKIQTIGVGIENSELRKTFCEAAAQKGVSRCVPVGTMNHFENPWDGMLPVSRLVRWVRVPKEEKVL